MITDTSSVQNSYIFTLIKIQQKAIVMIIIYNMKFVLMCTLLCTGNLIMLSTTIFSGFNESTFQNNCSNEGFPFPLWIPINMFENVA